MVVFYVVAGIKSGKTNVVQTMGSYRIPPPKSVVDPDSLNLEPHTHSDPCDVFFAFNVGTFGYFYGG
jgi:hypothetical protein